MATPRRTQVPAASTHAERSPAPASAAGGVPAEKIAARAYQIWTESGRPHGEHEEHWYRAERELRAKSR